MATSSIFESVRITDEKTAERLLAALEASERDQLRRERLNIKPEPSHELRDPEEIRAFFSKYLSQKKAK